MYKQSPIWIINSTLLFAFFCMLVFVLSTRYKLPKRSSLTAHYMPSASLKDVSKIDISRIYRNDLFNTYKDMPTPKPVEENKLVLPAPPVPQAAAPVLPRAAQFIEPLAVTLKGIMYSSDERANRAIISDAKSGTEKLYKVGDTVEDSEIVRIYYNKVILIRSNGQQETLFVTTQDAQKDTLYHRDISWSDIVQQKSPTEFTINKKLFIDAVKNLAEFIDMLDITMAFKRGRTVGCRIGLLKPQSLGVALGLQPNDIVITIGDIPTTTTNDRVDIYTKISHMAEHDTIQVTMLRDGTEITYTYAVAAEYVPPLEPADDSVSTPEDNVQQDLQDMHDMSTRLVMESQATKNTMLDRSQKDIASIMKKEPSSASLLQQVST